MPTITATGSAWAPAPTAQGYAYGHNAFFLSTGDKTLFAYDAGTHIKWRGSLQRIDFVVGGKTVAMVGCYPPVQGQYFTSGPLYLSGQLFEVPHVAGRYHEYGGWIQYEALTGCFRIGVGAPPATAMEVYGNGNIKLADLIERPKGEAESGLPVSLFEGLLHLTADGKLTVEALYESISVFAQANAPAPTASGTATRSIDASGETAMAAPVAAGVGATIWDSEGGGSAEAPIVEGAVARSISATGAGGAEAPIVEGAVARSISATGAGGAVAPTCEGIATRAVSAVCGGTAVAPSASGSAFVFRLIEAEGDAGAVAPTGEGIATRAVSATGGGTAVAPSASGSAFVFRLIEAEGDAGAVAPTAFGVATVLRYTILTGEVHASAPLVRGLANRVISASGRGDARAPRGLGFATRNFDSERQFYRVVGIRRMPGTGVAVATLESMTRPVNR